MRVIEIEGDAYERGRQQGEALRGEWAKMLRAVFDSKLVRGSVPSLVPESVLLGALGLAGVATTRRVVKKHLPAQRRRIAGLGDGLGTDRRLAWGIHLAEVVLCAAGRSLKAPVGCTQVHAVPRATAEGRPLMGRNYDFPNLLRDFQIVRRERPSEPGRLATTTVTQVPLAGAHQGVNEAGLAVAANNARLFAGPDLELRGVPYLLILQEILETCRRVPEAVERIVRFPARGNAGFFGIADETGECRVVEFTASRAAVREPDEAGVLAQTNHYHAMPDANTPKGTVWTVEGMEGLEYAESTGARFDAADRMLHEAAGSITVDTLKTILRDHGASGGTGSDCTVCAHGVSGGTLASILVDVGTRTLWVADGAPCGAEYREVPFWDGAPAARRPEVAAQP